MPAPDRVGQVQNFSNVINPTKGIVGHYSDLEIDALLTNLQVGGGGTVDLSAYATTVQLDATKTEIMTAATAAFQERYTKQETDGLFVKKEDMVAPPNLDGYATEQYVDDSIARIPTVDVIKAIEGKDIQPRGIAVGEGNIAFQGTYSFTVENVGIGPRPVVEYREGAQAKTLVCLTRDDAYTKAEVDTKADLTNTAQAITAKSVTAESLTAGAVQFMSQNAPNTALLRADVGGQERLVYAVGSKTFPIAFTSELTAGSSVDLSAYAKLNDAGQSILTKTLTAQAIGFGDSLVPDLALTYTDTGEGYGPRIVFAQGLITDYLVYKSDLDELNTLLPRVQTLENKSAPAQEAVDLSPYALKTDLLGLATEVSVAATYVTKADARIYTTAADVAAFVQANYTPKADHTSLADTVQTIFTNTYTKVETDELLKKYLTITTFTTWGANFYTKQAADAAFLSNAMFDNWQAAVLTPNYALKSEVPGAGVWKDLPLRAGFSTAAVGGRRAQYRIQFGYIELRGEVNRTGDYALDTEYHLATLPAADCPKEWVYGNGATYNGANPALPGVCHVGIKSGGEVIAVPLIRSAIRLYLDNVRVSTFK